MGFGENMYGEISSKSGSSVTYLPIMRPHKIEPASPIAVTRLSDVRHADFSPRRRSLPIKSYAKACVILIPRTRTRRLCNIVHSQWQQLLAP